jgi:hypothetical protein
MTPSDLIVGKYYNRPDRPQRIYLAIGKRKMWTGCLNNNGEMDEKHLVIVNAEDPKDIGLMVKEGDDTYEGFWDEFKILNEKLPTPNILTCVYCGHEYPEGTPPHGSQILTDHIKICEKHPLRDAEVKIAQLQKELEEAKAKTSLEGYRSLGQQVADALDKRDEAMSSLKIANTTLGIRDKQIKDLKDRCFGRGTYF